MGIVKVEIPGDFEITIKAKNIDEAIEKMKEIKKEKILKLWEKIKRKKLELKDWQKEKGEFYDQILDR
jgi:hypothetical protein